MKYSYNWLKELSGTKKSPKELAEHLSMHAFEFEGAKMEGKETQMEFSILPNRGHDAISHIGMAREICAIEGRKFYFLTSDVRNFLTSDVRKSLKVEIKDKKLCPRYIGAVLENIKVGPSPKWMKERLLVCGIKPINNIVDITNYVMLEFGQPLHAFDLFKIKSEFPISNFQFPNKSQNPNPKIQIIVRKARREEKVKLLDEKEHGLNENDLVIADSEKALALAGVMGGLESSITSKTVSIILESANFNPTNIRKTRTYHNIVTESSYRFEREIDPNLAEMGMARAIELIKKICGKNVEVRALADVYPKKAKPWQIRLYTDYVDSLLGEKIPVAKMKNILENLGLNIKNTKNVLKCEIPTHRIDLKTEEDLIEEIGRIFGYENIKEQPLVAEVKTPLQNKKRDFENELRDILAGLGFSEVMNYSFYGADDIQKCNLKVEDHIEVANPLGLDQQYLRWSLAPNLLKNIALNLKNFTDVKIFEIGNKFCLEKSKPREATVLVGAIADKSAKDNLFFDLKSKVEAALTKLGYKGTKYQILDTKYNIWHQTRAAEIRIGGKEIGRIGEVSPQVLRHYGMKTRVALFGIRLSELIEKVGYPGEKLYRPISKFPVVERDISMFVQRDTKFNEIMMKINESGGKLVKNVELFDSFEKDGQKSLALRLKIGSDVKTLTSSEIDAVMKKIISKLEKELKVKVRK